MNKIIFLIVTSFVCASTIADFGVWPHSQFLDKGAFYCQKKDSCKVPNLSDVYALKDEWQRFEGRRIAHLEFLKGELRGHLDRALGVAQEELELYDHSFFGQVLMKAAEVAEKSVSDLYEGELDLWVSNSSPFFLMLTELEILINQSKSGKLKVDQYRNWYLEQVDKVLRLKAIQERYFPDRSSVDFLVSLLNVEIPLAQGIEFKECSKALSSQFEKLLGSAPLFGEGYSFLESSDQIKPLFSSSLNKKQIQVVCQKGGSYSEARLQKISPRKFKFVYGTEKGIRWPTKRQIIEKLSY